MVIPLQKPALMALIVEHADPRGWVDVDTPDLARLTGIPQHDVVHALWDLQKQGWLRFREKHIPGGSELTRIRLTSVGRKAMEDLAAHRPLDAAMEVVEARESNPFLMEPRDYATITAAAHLADGAVGSGARPKPEQAVLDAGMLLDAGFPLIHALVQRRGKVEQAARLLEEAGEVDLALQAIEKAHTAYTPFEEEVIRLLGDLGVEM